MRTAGLLVLVFCLALGQGSLLAQYTPTTVEEIINNPIKFSEAAVQVDGVVTLYAAAPSSSTGHYLLRSDRGTVIRVRTSEGAPERNKKYRVTGIVSIDPNTKAPFINEKSRILFEDLLAAENAAKNPVESHWWEDPLALVFFALLVVLVGVLLSLQMRKRKARPLEPAGAGEEPEVLNLDESPPPPEDLKTVKIIPASPMTMKYVPGELVVVSGEDKGKAFKIAGFPTPEGSVITIGREVVEGERAYAHIQIAEKFHTVSRKHAEFIWKDKKLFVKNLSDTNPTQIDGVEVKSGKMVQVKPGSIVRTGELEFQYRI